MDKFTINHLLKAADNVATNDFIRQLDNFIQRAKTADIQLFNVPDEEVHRIGHMRDLRNARQAVLQMTNYLELAAMLAAHVKEDIHTIFCAADALDDDDKQRRKDIIAREEQQALSSKSNAKRRKETAGK